MKKSAVILNGLTTLAMAVTSAHAATTATTEAVVKPKLSDQMTMSFANAMYGPSIGQLNSDTQLNNDGTAGAPIFTRNGVSAGYKLRPNMIAGASVAFDTYARKNKTVQALDPYVRFMNTRLINSGNFNLAADFRAYAPVSNVSHERSQITSLMAKQVTSYDIPNSRFSVSAATYLRGYIYNTAGKSTTFEVDAAPQVDYRIRPNLSTYLMYEATAIHVAHTQMTDMRSAGTVVEPGISWDATPSLNVSGFVDYTPGNAVKTSTVNAGVTWRLL